LQPTSITVGWSGTLSATRGGFGADVSAQNGVPLFTAGAATFTATTGSGNVVLANDPTLTGVPSAPTAAVATNTTQIATTAFVAAAISSSGTFVDAPSDGSSYGRLNAGWAKVAPLVSAALAGTPTAPTQATSDNSTRLATTAFVAAAVSAGGGAAPATAVPLVESGSGAVGTSVKYAREDHVHPASFTTTIIAGGLF
jgi:hypothetical protein